MSWPKIPTSGKARVLAELTGQIGKGSNMQRRFRRRSFGPKRHRFWYAEDPRTIAAGGLPQNLTLSGPGILTGFNPSLASSTQYLEKLRVHMVQGSCPVMVVAGPDLAQTAQSWIDRNQPVFMWYWWTRDRLDPSTEGAPVATSRDPDPRTDLQNILRTGQVLNWGFRELSVPYLQPRFLTQGQSTSFALQTPTDQYNNMLWPGGRKLSFIPKPRIPKMGLNLDRGTALICYYRIAQYDNQLGDWKDAFQTEGGNESGLNAVAMPMWRFYMSR